MVHNMKKTISVLNTEGEIIQVEIKHHLDEDNKMYFTIDPTVFWNGEVRINKMHSL